MATTARDLRKRQTTAEDVLWSVLRNRKLHGLKFRRQHPIGPYVVDFCCYERKLILELDGSIHDLTVEQDADRSLYLEARSFRVIRFRNEQIFANLDAVLCQIQEAAKGG